MRNRRAAVVAVLIAGVSVAVAAVAIHDVPDAVDTPAALPQRPTPAAVGHPERDAPRPPPEAHQADQPPVLELPASVPGRPLVVPILMYHRIDAHTSTLPEITHRLTVLPESFARQIAWLHDRGYHAITQRELFDALVRDEHLDARPVLITFDDGYRDVFGQASEALTRLGMHATAYVITGRISGQDSSFLTWPLLRSLERRGIEIGSHTVSHVDLTQLTDAALSRELRESRETLERGLGHPVQWLSYPFGSVDDRVVAAAREAGYVLAVTTVAGRTQHQGCALELRRLRILDSTTLDELEWMLTTDAGRPSAGC